MVGKESVSLTRALVNLNSAKAYLEDMIIDFPWMKTKIKNWINKITFVENDALCSMTPKGREAYRREITFGDPMFYENMFCLLIEMSPEQRNLIEKAAEGLLKGQIEITGS